MEWLRLLAYITGRVDKELLVRNEYLATENRILRAKIKGRLQLSDGEKRTLAEIAHLLGRKALAEVAVAAKPDTILRWFRELVAGKFDGSRRVQKLERAAVRGTRFRGSVQKLDLLENTGSPSIQRNELMGAKLCGCQRPWAPFDSNNRWIYGSWHQCSLASGSPRPGPMFSS